MFHVLKQNETIRSFVDAMEKRITDQKKKGVVDKLFAAIHFQTRYGIYRQSGLSIKIENQMDIC